MTQEEKAKAYDEALEKARKMLNMILDNELLGFPDQIREIFPQLRESNDERIREELIEYHKRQFENNRDQEVGLFHKDAIAWLEKQKENIEKEYVFRPLAGTDITIAAKQAIRKADEGDHLVLAFNGAYIPVRKGVDANKIVDIYDNIIEKQKEPLPIPDKFSELNSLLLQYFESAVKRNDDTEIESDTDLWGRKILDYVRKHDEKQKEQSWMPTEEEMGVLYKLCYVSTQISDDDDTELTRLYQDLKREYFNGRSFENMFPKAEKEQKPIKMEVYEVGKGTTICGQDYKCKKDYKEGNCWYIKDVVYHCSRDGYLTDQNGISWSCTPEWFKEYIQSNTEWAELTWKDINELERIINNVHYEFQNGIGEDSFGELVLERFKEYKDDGSMDEQKPAECERQPEFKEVEYDFRGEKVKVMRPFFRDDKGREFSTTGQDTDLTWSVLREWCEIKGITPFDLYPRAEWSEEDEKKLERVDDLLWMLDDYLGNDCSICEEKTARLRDEIHNELFPWLEFLRPQYHGDVTMTEAYKMGLEAGKASSWKPSEHQMTILKAVKEYVGRGSGYWGEALGSLIEDLEKL